MGSPAIPSVAPAPLPEPLRLPRGSVHGLLALTLMGTFGYLLARAGAAPQVLVNAVVVCIAFYFGSHTNASTPGAVVAAGATPSRRPRIVRGLLFLGFAGLTGWIWRSGVPLGDVPELVEIWQVLGGYLLGLSLSWFFHRRVHESPLRRRLALVFRDLSALGALGLTVFACYSLVTGLAGSLNMYVEQALSLVITYYFGSRVIAH